MLKSLSIVILFFPVILQAGFKSKINKGYKYYEKKEYHRALKYYMDALMEKPLSPAAHYNLGNTYYKLKEYKKALEEYNKAFNLTKDKKMQENILYNTGNIYFRLRDYKKAIDYYKKALDLNPDDEDAKYNIEIALKRLKQQKEEKKQSRNNKSGEQKQNKGGNKGNKEKKGKQRETSTGKRGGMTREEAERLLQALKDEEKKVQKKVRKMRGEITYVEKD